MDVDILDLDVEGRHCWEGRVEVKGKRTKCFMGANSNPGNRRRSKSQEGGAGDLFPRVSSFYALPPPTGDSMAATVR